MSAIIPQPRYPITTRPATTNDLPFIDSLQKMHTKMVGWMPTKQLEGKIGKGHVLIAEERHEGTEARRHEGELSCGNAPLLPAAYCPLPAILGYCIAHDQYFKRDDVGIIYQMNVVPGKQRGLIGAALLKAQFERSAWGCKLYCCWCAQDIAANHFWEAMGFVPLAFRAGSEKKRRVHIFWQKRIRQGDTTTPWWFPSQTTGGSMMEDRLVFPIPPGTHWSDAKPIVLPRDTHLRQLEDAGKRKKMAKQIKPDMKQASKRAPLCGGLMFDAPQPVMKREGKTGQRKTKIKNDPKFVAAARELRDRWLEQVNAGQYALHPAAKYEVSKYLPKIDENRPCCVNESETQPLLLAAA